MVLFLHNRYRTTGGEERVVADLMWLVREHLGEPAQLLERDSGSSARVAAAGALLAGGVDPGQVEAAVRAGSARLVHAHNLNPGLGWRALAAARRAGAAVVLHLHNYRLVCAVGVCFTRGQECTRCHARNTAPGVLRNCRGSGAEAAVYGAALSLWQRRLIAQADAVVVPSAFAHRRLRELGAPLGDVPVHVVAPPVRPAPAPAGESLAGPVGTAPYALVAARLAPEKGVPVAIEACRQAGIALVVAGDGPLRGELERVAGARTSGPRVTFLGALAPDALARVRAGAAVAVAPSLSAETFGLAAAEAMAAGVPVAASRIGALPELVEEAGLAVPGDAADLARALSRQLADPLAGGRARERAARVAAPEAVAAALGRVYEAVAPGHSGLA